MIRLLLPSCIALFVIYQNPDTYITKVPVDLGPLDQISGPKILRASGMGQMQPVTCQESARLSQDPRANASCVGSALSTVPECLQHWLLQHSTAGSIYLLTARGSGRVGDWTSNVQGGVAGHAQQAERACGAQHAQRRAPCSNKHPNPSPPDVLRLLPGDLHFQARPIRAIWTLGARS